MFVRIAVVGHDPLQRRIPPDPSGLVRDSQHLQAQPFQEPPGHRPFTTRDSINEFRDIMLKRPAHDRYVWVTKVVRDTSQSMVKKPDEELLLGMINILGLEMESLRDVLYLKKSNKAGIKKGQDNPYNLHPGEKILARFPVDSK